MAQEPTLKERVHEELRNALENGYQEMFITDSPWTIAIDLATYSAEMEGYDPGALEPHIKSFLSENKELLERYAK